MYTIKLANGTELTGLELNGNNFISDTILEDSVFEGNLDTVEIYDGENTQQYEDMRLMNNQIVDGKSWFIIGAKSEEYKTREKLDILMATMLEG